MHRVWKAGPCTCSGRKWWLRLCFFHTLKCFLLFRLLNEVITPVMVIVAQTIAEVPGVHLLCSSADLSIPVGIPLCVQPTVTGPWC